MNDTVELPERELTWVDHLRYVMDVMVPILLTATIVSLVLFRADVTNTFADVALRTRVVSCTAVKESNDDLDAFLASRAGANDGEFNEFRRQLVIDHAATYRQCLHSKR